MEIECWQKGKLIARHKCSDQLTTREIKERFGLGDNWTIKLQTDGEAPHTVQWETGTHPQP